MTIKEAIKKAIKGKWKFDIFGGKSSILIMPGFASQIRIEGTNGATNLSYSDIFLDPQFWQCLGRAMGWESRSWKDFWHEFIDYLAEGKTAEQFFKDLK